MDLYVWRYNVRGGYNNEYLTVEPYYEADRVIDVYSSLVWCERYQKPGEFKLVLRATPELLRYFQDNELMITRSDSRRAMIPDRIRLTTSHKNGNVLEITGKSAEGLTDRRVITQETGISNMGAQEAIAYYMQENIASYWYYNAASYHSTGYHLYRFLNFLEHGIDDGRINTAVSASPYGMKLSQFIEDVCKSCNFGFKMEFDKGKLYYSSYMGLDRTKNQLERDMVVFSEDFGNLGNTEYIYDKNYYVNNAIVSSSGKQSDRVTEQRCTNWRYPYGVGSNMREKYVNSSISPDGTLQMRAFDVLSKPKIEFDGETTSGGQFKYREHYDLGDTVTVENLYGITGSAVVSQVDETIDMTGHRVVPHFSEWRLENA